MRKLSGQGGEKGNGGGNLVEHLFRHQHGKILSTLLREFGVENAKQVEDATQEAFLKALSTWPLRGAPENPSGWLQRVARNAAIDQFRRQGRSRRLTAVDAGQTSHVDSEPTAAFVGEVADNLLATMFACCAAEIPERSRAVIILKWLSGFSTREIARALLESESAVAQRLSRARQKLQESGGALMVPTGKELTARLPVVQQALYLLFNEGYSSSQPDALVRKELCEEAMRLTSSLLEHPACAETSTHALMALFCFHAARLATRQGGAYELLLLSEQDRGKWNKALIARGMEALRNAGRGSELSRYHLEAGIAACHIAAGSIESTNWREISYLYRELHRLTHSPVVALNLAIAVSYDQGTDAGQAVLKELVDEARLDNYCYYWAVAADFERRDGNLAGAVGLYERAHAMATNNVERQFLAGRIEECRGSD